MSDRIQKTLTDVSNKTLASPSERKKFTIVDSSEQLNLRNLSDATDYLQVELNNNSILSSEGSGEFKMESRRKSNEMKQVPGIVSASSIPTSDAEQNDSKQASNQNERTSRYTSLFNSIPVNRSNSPMPEQRRPDATGGRGSLRKQVATEKEAIESTLGGLSKKKLPLFSYSSGNEKDDVDFLEDDEINERLPFKSRTIKKTQESQLRSQSSGRHSMQTYSSEQDFANQQINPHTKISFNDSRPPSFNVHQPWIKTNSRGKLDSQQLTCPQCDCNSCCKHRKLAFVEGRCYNTEGFRMKHSKTRSMHLVLKSIILILLTLLLLLILVGIIMASHYLPQVLDRVLNASRSFNVTIAGKR